MILSGNFYSSLNVLEQLKSISGSKAKMALLEQNPIEELKYFLYITNCQFIVTRLSNIKDEFIDPMSCLERDDIIEENVFNKFKELIETLKNSKSANNKIREDVSYFLSFFNDTHKELLKQIITKKLKIGINSKSINKVWKNFIPTPSLMLATDAFDKTVKEWPLSNIIIDEKFDGGRIAAVISPQNSIIFYTRSFNPIFPEYLPTLTQIILKLGSQYRKITNRADSSILFDSEMLPTDEFIKNKIKRAEIKDESGFDSANVDTIATESRKSISGDLTRMVRGTFNGDDSNVLFKCFDVVEFTGDIFSSPTILSGNQLQRKEMLFEVSKCLTQKELKNFNSCEYNLITSDYEIYSIYDKLIAEGKEGIIAKLADAPYKFARSKSWQKLKAINTIDLRCHSIALGEPDGAHAHRLGRIICKSDDNKICVSVGSGFSDEQRDYFWKNQNEIVNAIVEIKYNTIISDKTGESSLFLPRFQCVRIDKTETDLVS